MIVRTAIRTALGMTVMLWCAALAPAAVPPASVLVVAHADTPSLNEDALQKIYLGKVVEVNGMPVVPVNLAKGSALRKDFMERVMAQDDDKFIAYWTVRRYIGKGSPPKEFDSVEEQIAFIRSTPGAVGYIAATAEVGPGLKAILRKP